jgi:hypothetical protein
MVSDCSSSSNSNNFSHHYGSVTCLICKYALILSLSTQRFFITCD